MQLPSLKKTFPRILIIEPDENIINFIRFGLQDEGYETESCQEYSEVLKAVKTIQPNLVILNLDFPDEHGFNLCRQLRAEEITKQCPIITLTERDTNQMRHDAHDAGANTFITIPFEFNKILEEIDLFIAHLNPFRLRPQRSFIIKSPAHQTDLFQI